MLLDCLNRLPDWASLLVWSALILLLTTLIGRIAGGVIGRWLTRWANTTSWQWDEVNDRHSTMPSHFNLLAGNHTIKVKLREDGTKLDKLLLTNDMNYTPTGVGQ